MEIDVFTLFPEAFTWFAAQRHVTNALAGGHSLGLVNYRDHTPLSGRQVDDTPFGGGAGMVLRVDVVEAALRPRSGRAGGRAAGARARPQRPAVRRRPRRRARGRAGRHDPVGALRGLRRA